MRITDIFTRQDLLALSEYLLPNEMDFSLQRKNRKRLRMVVMLALDKMDAELEGMGDNL